MAAVWSHGGPRGWGTKTLATVPYEIIIVPAMVFFIEMFPCTKCNAASIMFIS